MKWLTRREIFSCSRDTNKPDMSGHSAANTLSALPGAHHLGREEGRAVAEGEGWTCGVICWPGGVAGPT